MSEEQNVSGEQYYNMTSEQITEAYDYVSQELPLIDFATEKLGWQVDLEQEDDRGLVLNHKEHGTIIASRAPNPNSGDWEFVWANGKGGGTLIELLRKEEWELDEIRALKNSSATEQFTTSRSLSAPHYEQRREQDPEKQTELAQKRFAAVKSEPGSSCLEQQGIDRQLYASFPQMKTNSREATFKLYNVVEGRAHVCSTVSYSFDSDGKSKYFFQRGLPRGLAVLREDGPVERIVVSPSPISALSFKQLEKLEAEGEVPRTMYVSTCGNLTERMKEDITHLFKQAKEQDQWIVLVSDNYWESARRTNAVAWLAGQQGLDVRISSPPTGEDWNDYLGLLQFQKKYTELASPELTASLPAQQFESAFTYGPDYKGTLLEKLGVSEKTCEDMRGYTVNERAISFPLYTNFREACRQEPIGIYNIFMGENRLVRDCSHRGTAPGLVVLPTEERSQAIVVTSDPLDIFYHRAEQQAKFKASSISPPVTTYVSTSHQDAREVKKPLKALLEDLNQNHVTLYMNPEAAEQLKSQLGSEVKIDGQLQPLRYDTYIPSQAAWRINNGLDTKEGETSALVPQEELQKEVTQATDHRKNMVSEDAPMTASKEPEPVDPLQASLHKTPTYEKTLLEALSISEEACKGLKGYQASEKQLTFPLYATGQAVKEQKPMGSYQLKLEDKGLMGYTATSATTPGLVVLPAKKSPKVVVITSSPLDIFLHRYEQKTHIKDTSRFPMLASLPPTTYISTCGQDSKALEQPLKDILSQHKDTKVVFYMHDAEANTLHTQLESQFSREQRFTYQVSPPSQALWHQAPHKQGQDIHKVGQEEPWKQVTPQQSQDKGLKMKGGI